MTAQINIDSRNLYNLDKENAVKNWISEVVNHHGFTYSEINYTFYTDEELLQINIDYLSHNFYTDIITFDNTINKTISADIAISIDRIKENAKLNKQTIFDEILRVMVHGVLHCIGFKDKTPDDQHLMRKEENKMINMFHVEHSNVNDHV